LWDRDKNRNGIIVKKLLLLVLLFLAGNAFCSEKKSENEPLTIYAIPGQNGKGATDLDIEPLFCNIKINIITIETPLWFPDFGQNRCMSYLDEAIKKHKKPGIIFAASQGTATALNWLATTSKENQEKIKAVICDAPFASGNDAINYNITKRLPSHFRSFLLSFRSYYLLPYLAKLFFPFYSPGGKQPIKLIKKIPNEIPIIISHSRGDPELSFAGSCALYGGLCKNNKNAYFIESYNECHMGNFQDTSVNKTMLKILNEYSVLGLNYCFYSRHVRRETQPESTDYFSLTGNTSYGRAFQELLFREYCHKLFKYTLNAALVAGAGYVILKNQKKLGSLVNNAGAYIPYVSCFSKKLIKL
jgi:hypothetical protein